MSDMIGQENRDDSDLLKAYGNHFPKQKSLKPSSTSLSNSTGTPEKQKSSIPSFIKSLSDSFGNPEWKTVDHLRHISETLDKMYELMLEQRK